MLLEDFETWAVVGCSPDPRRDSHPHRRPAEVQRQADDPGEPRRYGDPWRARVRIAARRPASAGATSCTASSLEKCVGCSLCAAACPSDCIRVVAAENTPENRVSAGERYAAVYEINLALHLLRLLRGRLPVRRDHDGPGLRDVRLQPLGPHLHQGDAPRRAARAHPAPQRRRVVTRPGCTGRRDGQVARSAGRACDNDRAMHEPTRVTLTEVGLAGDYVVAERHADGSVLLAPDTSIEAIRKRSGTRAMTPGEFEGHFGHLPSDGEG